MQLSGLESPVKRFIPQGKDAQDRMLSRIQQDLDMVREFFHERHENRQRNIDFYMGKQWTDAEVSAHLVQNRYAYVFNEIQNKVDHLVGTQNQTRFDVKVMPRESADEKQANLLDHLVKFVEQVNDLETIETEVFFDTLLGGCAVSQIRWQMEDIHRGYPKIELVPTAEMYWDATSTRADLQDARWIARVVKMTRMDAVELFPHKQKEILNTNATFNTSSSYIDKVQSYKEELLARSLASEESREEVEIVEYYERAKVNTYVVYDDIYGKDFDFDQYADAKAFYDGLIEKYEDNGEILVYSDNTPKVGLVVNTEDAIFQTIVVGDRVISYEHTDLPDFPYVVNFGYYHEGFFWGFVDNLIDPQILTNRFFSQWDYQLGTSSKNAITVQTTLLKKDFQLEDLRREWSKTSPIIPVNRHEAINQVPNQQVNPELFQGIQFAILRMQEYAGGKNALGLQENAAESGRAVVARAEQGGLSRLSLFDRLRKWRLQLTTKVIWYIKNYMSPHQVLRIMGADKTVEYVHLDTEILETLEEIKVDILVDEAVNSDSMKERQFMQLKEFFQVVPNVVPPEIIVEMLAELSSMPRSTKEKLKNSMQFYKEYQQKVNQAAEEQKLQDSVLKSLRKKEIKERLEGSQEMENATREYEKKRKQYEKAKADAGVERDELEKLKQELENAEGSLSAFDDAVRDVSTQNLGNALAQANASRLN